MLARGDLALEADIRSDTAPLGGLVDALLDGGADAPAGCATRRAAASARSRNELARDTGLAVVLDEAALPVLPAVNGACDLLGIDPLYVANEGKLVAVVAGRARPTLRSPRCAAIRSAPPPRSSARSRPSPRASSCCARRSAAPASSTCSSATRCPRSAEWLASDDAHAAPRHRHGAGRRLPAVRVPPRGRARARGLGAQRQRRRAHRRRGRARPHRRARPASSSTKPPPLARVATVTPERAAPSGERDGFSHRRERRVGRAVGAGERRHRHVRRVPGRGRRSRRPPLPLPVHELHQLRAALHDRARRSLRPAGHDHGAASRCAPAAEPSTTTRPTVASTPSPTPARSAGRSSRGATRSGARARPTATSALAAAVDALRGGAVVAVKGIGGYHLAVDATNADAVARAPAPQGAATTSRSR